MATISKIKIDNTEHSIIDTNTAHSHDIGVGLIGSGNDGISGTYTYKVKLKNETALTIDSVAATTTSGRVYPVAVDKSGYLSVNVPWVNTNTTYSAGTGLNLSGTTFNHSNSITAGSVGSAQSPAHGGTFAIPKITYDAQGHITGATTVNITLPADSNTDTKVTNTLATTTKAYITGTTSATTNTGTQVFDTGVYLDTTAGQLVATTFKGNLSGNATTATSATSATSATTATKLGSSTLGNATNPVYLNSGTATICNTYAGGTAVTLNNSSKASSTASFYAPTAGGTSGYVLTGAGTTSEPTWTAQSSLSVGTATKLSNNAGGVIQPVYFSSGIPVLCNVPSSGAYWNGVCRITSDGVMKVGKYIDFHNTKTSTSASGDVRVLIDGSSQNTVYLPNVTGRVVTSSHNAAVGSTTIPVYISSTGAATACNLDIVTVSSTQPTSSTCKIWVKV